MPEIAEVTRIVHFLRTHLKNRRIASIITKDDDIVYGKVGTSAAEFQKALTGRTVVDAKQQGKYFWLEMDKPPHPVMHFGMTGWLKLSNVETGYYRSKKEEKKKEKENKSDGGPEAVYNNAGSTRVEEQDWPPPYYKFILQMEGEPSVEAAFVDARRLGRIRLVHAPADQMRKTTPLKENGPDPVIDKDILTVQWLTEKLRSKRSPVKAVLLDQANISGVGNWVGDEVLYHAKIHPEQYSNTLSDAQCKQLHDSLTFICTTACDLLGDSDQFPADWLFKHRWNKGKKDANVLPNGAKIAYLTVGGRTSAIVPSVQKKTGPVAGDVKREEDYDEDDGESKPKTKGKKGKPGNGNSNGTDGKTASPKKRKATEVDVKEETTDAVPPKKTKPNGTPKDSGKRRSTRGTK